MAKAIHRSRRILVTGVDLAASLAWFLAYSLMKKSLSMQEVFALGMILGGALGNIGDRLLLGQVVDYLDFTWIDYPIFNLADAFIFCGICLLAFHYVFQNRRNDLKLTGL